MQRRELLLQFNVVVMRPGDVPRTAGSSTRFVDGEFHGLGDDRVLPHAEIIVAAPDGNLAHAMGGMVICRREIAAMTEDIGEDPVPAFALQFGNIIFEDVAVRERHRFCSPALDGFLYDHGSRE